MELVTRALGSLILKLGELLKDEYNLHKGLKDEVKSLSEELKSAQAALDMVANNVPPGYKLDTVVKLWSDEVREASYDMEDALDAFLVRVEGCKPADPHGAKWFNLKEKICKLLRKRKDHHEIADMIKSIKKRVDEVGERRRRYQVGDDIVAWPAASSIDPRLTSMYKEVRQLVGIDQPRDDIISLLSMHGGDASKGEVKVVSVFGVGGLGKTTLAKASYDTLKMGFDCSAFVPVGQKPDLKKVLRDILIDLNTKVINIAILDERQLIDELQDFLENKRYFIVIDDIWELESWETIKSALMKNNHGSRIITTTRKFNVAREAGHAYELQRLSYDNSRKLFCARIFGGEGSCLGSQEDEITNKILKKCDGVPLAIITMASLLVGKRTEQWPELYSAIGFGNKDNKHVENTMKILSFSYDDLPTYLRTCLLYLSAFPEDYVIDKDALIWKWVAEGFVDKKQGKGLFEVGEGYFNELINRSMILAVESSKGWVYGCRVHDMVLELIRSLSCEVNCVTIINNCEDTQSQRTVRRIAYQNRTLEFSTCVSQIDMQHVRSLIACMYNSLELVLPFSSFKVLRVLALEDLGGSVDINLVPLGNLVHLRYLGINGTNYRSYELPEEIRALKFLQTLNIYGDSFKGRLPSSISLLTQLVCLRADSVSSGYDGIGKLTSLEELRLSLNSYVCSDNSIRQFFMELGCLTELRVLETQLPCMADEIMVSDLMESLRKLQHIRILTVTGASDIKEAAGFFLHRNLQHLDLDINEVSRLPSYCINSSCLPYLAHLSLIVKDVDEQDLISLGGLPELRYLDLLMKCNVSVNNLPGRDGFFKKLRFCVMRHSMIQFLPNEDSSVSFHICSRTKGEMPFGRNKKNDKCRIARNFMPNVEVLEFRVPVRALGNFSIRDDGLGLEYLSSLEKIIAYPNCKDANAQEVKMVESDLRLIATHIHPKRPTLKMKRTDDQHLKKIAPRREKLRGPNKVRLASLLGPMDGRANVACQLPRLDSSVPSQKSDVQKDDANLVE